ncbi:putative nucleoporin nucleoporin alpha-helical domain-containing protein [Helianthus annuus]|nr:putative nucleoporin nucleoporin alpha-helical domain-containing protein [Helianthus annuus]
MQVFYLLLVSIFVGNQINRSPFATLSSSLQDEVIVSDAERLQMTQTNVKVLQRHFQADTFPRIERLRQSEKALQRRLLRVNVCMFFYGVQDGRVK